MSHVVEVAAFAASAAAAAAAGQVLLMPQVHAWEAELIAVFMRELPRL
jgi:hypothetical protein